MGHTRLGTIPKSKKWKDVVAALTEVGGSASSIQDEVAGIAALTLEAAKSGMDSAIDDPGLRYTFYLLTQIVLAAREDDWQGRLLSFGIRLGEDASVFDLTVSLQAAIDDYRFRQGVSTDVSEIAQISAGYVLGELASPYARTLFGEGRDELGDAVSRLGTKAGFADLGQHFFGDLLSRILNFYLSRATASEIGHPKLGQVGDIAGFNDALNRHCFQSARITHDFCGEWYSKTEFREGINLANTSGFLAVAIKKLQAELQQQRSGT